MTLFVITDQFYRPLELIIKNYSYCLQNITSDKKSPAIWVSVL